MLKELPEKTQEKILTEMTDEQKKVYLAYMNDLKSDIDDEVKKETALKKAESRYWRLQGFLSDLLPSGHFS